MHHCIIELGCVLKIFSKVHNWKALIWMTTFQSYSKRMLCLQSVNQKHPLLPSPIRNVAWYLKPSKSEYQHNLGMIAWSFQQAFKTCFSGDSIQHASLESPFAYCNKVCRHMLMKNRKLVVCDKRGSWALWRAVKGLMQA